MIEEEWLAATYSTPLFEVLRERRVGSARKRLLLGFACCDLVRPLMSEDGRRAVEVAGLFSRGEASEAERWEAFERAGEAMEVAADLNHQRGDWCAYRQVQLAGETGNPTRWDHDTAAQIAQSVPEAFAWTGSKWDEAILTSYRLVIVGWVRDIFPFRPVTLDSAWLTSTVLALAQQMYDSHDFSAMPILADAFMDSGCDNDEILNHCRDPKQVHVRGCWVVDAILGKE